MAFPSRHLQTSDTFPRLKNRNAVVVLALSLTLPGNLQHFPRPLSWIWGRFVAGTSGRSRKEGGMDRGGWMGNEKGYIIWMDGENEIE